MNLATEMRITQRNFAQMLTQKNRAERERRQQAEADEIKRQMEEAPKIAAQIIAGLPAFLESIATKRSCAYVLNRNGCEPYEDKYPDFERAPRSARLNDLSDYKIRRYLRGTVQHVARWGLKQGFGVGLGTLYAHNIQDWEAQERIGLPFPVYMPGMFWGHVPTLNYQILYFSW